MKTMNMPGFTAEASLYKMSGRFQASRSSFRSGIVEPAFPIGRTGELGTLPTCGPENCRTAILWVPCGSPLPDAPTPMCPGGTTTECDYVCRWPSGIKGTM
jgi:hypothetical protein